MRAIFEIDGRPASQVQENQRSLWSLSITSILEGHDHFMRNAMLTGGDDGMITRERSLATLVRDRLIDRETAIRTATDPKILLHLMEGLPLPE